MENEKVYIYTMEFYSVVQGKNEIIKFTRKWKELEDIIWNEVIQAKKHKHHVFSLIYGS